jgi:RND superfamily putative drug exporter
MLIISVPLAGDGTNPASMRALAYLRDTALPATVGKLGGISYAVGGTTAASHDFSAALHARAPIVLVFALGLAFLLLVMVFSSVIIPAITIVLNLLSIGAAYGVLKLIFQDGYLAHQLGFTPYGGIVPYLPLFMFVLLFGLSMDYQVFILSRICELRNGGATTTGAIIRGISGSAGVVTSAAIIMVAVFSIFATLSVIDFKMFGVGMACAVLIDATIVRGILLPAAWRCSANGTGTCPVSWPGWPEPIHLPGGDSLASVKSHPTGHPVSLWAPILPTPVASRIRRVVADAA